MDETQTVDLSDVYIRTKMLLSGRDKGGKIGCNYPQSGLPMVTSQVSAMVNVLFTLSTKRTGSG